MDIKADNSKVYHNVDALTLVQCNVTGNDQKRMSLCWTN
ncbi:hypothetical protein GARC_2524 [Paraglaciecola arctica BSs20135]|uniref:Uncharacterized protein n=1 Tax=Paraglaciecola arctica BSs20135 TaxID=493475 RepID=K6Z7S0_9ALTE|nr:hypothetical protein GARC_2524 [Paraglaciecola arctica BSs20135]